MSRLITKGLKEKIEANARELNFLPKTFNLTNIGDIMKQDVRSKGFDALETLQMKNRIKELEYDNAELVKSNNELRERCKKLASKPPE